MTDFELAIIGGGINGAGIARDAAGRGIRVLLVEQNDLASGTSSASTKLIHGGLRYVEQGHFRLVREALTERETLLKIAPHIIWPLRIILPHEESMRPAWVLRLGLFIYDHLGGRKILPPTQVRNLTHGMYGDPLKRRHRVGFEFSDCWVDDSRLVVLNAMDAAARGATIRTRTQCVRADREDGTWRLVLKSRSGERETVTARALVNAAGPWAPITAETVLRIKPAGSVRLVKGSHIVLPRLFDHDRAYLLQMPDRRVVFAIPYERNFTLVGTTDQDFVGDLASVAATADEIVYLCRAVNEYFRTTVTPTDIVHAFAGVRPLFGEDTRRPSELSRDYVLHLDRPPGGAPLLSVYGGKITTYRKLAEAALARLGHFFAARAPWTSHGSLPGGDFPVNGVERLVADARERWAYLTAANARRLVRAYGTRLERIFEGAPSFDAAGPWFGFELSAAEVSYLVRHEWAETADDILWRRTKLGLRMPPAHRTALEVFLVEQKGSPD